MATEAEWQDMLRKALADRITRQDVEIAIRVHADPSYAIEDFDEVGFANWAADWVDFTMASSFGPLMPGTNEGEWTTGANEEVKVSLLLDKRTG
jgi:phage terminase large subunit-like protein